MKRLTYLAVVKAILIAAIIIFNACNKEDKNPNILPSCNITAPTNVDKITFGESVTISAEAIDSDGSIIEVRFLIDNVERGSSSSLPYKYHWASNHDSIGFHTIKATSIDNKSGTYSDEIMIEILPSHNTGVFTDQRDGQAYQTVAVGSQTWFAENLNYETSNSWWYENDPTNGDVYGRLYTWDDAFSACPVGWHLAGDDEWKILEMYLGMSESEAEQDNFRGEYEGRKMKSTSGWTGSGNGSNAFGFTAFPGGYYQNGEFKGVVDYAAWWSATEYGTSYAWSRALHHISDEVRREYYVKGNGFSVRCVKN